MKRIFITPIYNQSNLAFNGSNLFNMEITQPDGREYYQLITNMAGTIQTSQKIITSEPINSLADIPAELINSSTILSTQKEQISLWNIDTNTSQVFYYPTHHDSEYNPLTQTFLTLQQYLVMNDEHTYVYDRIVEYNINGEIVWSLNTDSFISPSTWCPYFDKQGDYRDITHANSLFWDFEEDIIYLNVRNVNTFYKINHKTSQVVWGLGEYGDFTLYDQNGYSQESLWYHGHSVQQFDDNQFILFDNDFHNQSNPDNHRSRIIEIIINETSMIANISWSWIAPPEYYSFIWGDVSRLPNGNRLAAFGALQQTTEARIIEIDDSGRIVWELYFPQTSTTKYGVYRVQRFRKNPIITDLEDKEVLAGDVTIQWQTWYNFMTKMRMKGSYQLFLNGLLMEEGAHVFNKFWRPNNLSIQLKDLIPGKYNLTLILSDESGRTTVDSLNLKVVSFHPIQQIPTELELNNQNSIITWEGVTSIPLNGSIFIDGELSKSFLWNGSHISYNLSQLEPGDHQVSLILCSPTHCINNENYDVIIYPSAPPEFLETPSDQFITWNTTQSLKWTFQDISPNLWILYVNNTVQTFNEWINQQDSINWTVPFLNEGVYNITIVLRDIIGHVTVNTVWLTIVPPLNPIIVTHPNNITLFWGHSDPSLVWEIHGGTKWVLWKNGSSIYNGVINNTTVEIRTTNWAPGIYNITLQVISGSFSVSQTSWICVFVNPGDPFANSLVLNSSMWFMDGMNVLGQPDTRFTRLYYDYGNGHVTVDMGLHEEIINGPGIDFNVISRGGKYVVFGSNNLSIQIGMGNQVESPFIMIGEGSDNSSFDLDNVGLEQVRYIQIAYIAGDEVEVDAIVASHFNRPPSPPSEVKHLDPIFIGGIFVLVIVGGYLIWKRK